MRTRSSGRFEFGAAPEHFEVERRKPMPSDATTAYLPHAPAASDHDAIRSNGMWYQPWQGGYQDILKRGVPRPADERTILAELHSPQVPDFLHGGGSGEVPFLVSERAKACFERHQLSGIEFAPVQVTKIATQGTRVRASRRGEPEDAILKSRGVSLELAPTLFAVYVVDRLRAVPDFESGRHPSGRVSPFDFESTLNPHDLWRPECNGKPFAAWAFCSSKFRSMCTSEKLTNIAFEPFGSFMNEFRSSANERRS
jgi:hypothetical protein